MHSFLLKDNFADIDTIVTRALLALAAVVSLVYGSDTRFHINIIAGLILLLASVFIRLLLQKLKLKKFLLLAAAAILLFLATGSVVFAVILILYGSALKFLYKTPSIAFESTGIRIRKLFSSPVYTWDQFSNIVLKDYLLTLDFKNNKLLQLSLEENQPLDEKAFNTFCASQLGQ